VKESTARPLATEAAHRAPFLTASREFLQQPVQRGNVPEHGRGHPSTRPTGRLAGTSWSVSSLRKGRQQYRIEPDIENIEVVLTIINDVINI
jgi:hypothetical protein